MAGRRGLKDLNGCAVAITGAAHGIGRALAEALWARGCHLALLDVDANGLRDLQGVLLASTAGRTCSTHVVDVGNAEQMEAAARAVHVAHPTLHVLVNNAGLAHEAPFQQITLASWRRIVDVNLWGVIHGCHFFLPLLARADRAHIVNMSSLFGTTGMAGQGPYCTTKYAVRGLSESMWEELRDTGVGLTVVHPGGVATGIMANAEGNDPALMQHLVDWYQANAYPPAKAAAQIVRAIERGTPRLMITAEARLVDIVKRLFPVWGNRLICSLLLRVLKLTHVRAVRRQLWQRTMVDGEPWT